MYKDLRDEIKRRVDERNKYFIQSIITFGAILAFSYDKDSVCAFGALLLGPWLSLLFLFLIHRSFTIGENIKLYLKSWVEPSLLKMSNIPTWQIFREEFRRKNPRCALESKLSNFMTVLVLAFIVPIIFICTGIIKYSDMPFSKGMIAVIMNGILWSVVVIVFLILNIYRLILCTHCESRKSE